MTLSTTSTGTYLKIYIHTGYMCTVVHVYMWPHIHTYMTFILLHTKQRSARAHSRSHLLHYTNYYINPVNVPAT